MPKGKKGAGDPADGPDVDAGAKAIAEVMSLRTQLGMRQTALTDAETAKRQAEEKLAKLRADFDQEQETAYEISKDMTRQYKGCLLYTSPSPRDQRGSRMPSSA